MKRVRTLCRRLAIAAVVVTTGLVLSAAPCFAINVVEAWRVALDSPGAISVDPDDGSCVFASDGDIIRLAADGSVLQHLDGAFDAAAVNIRDDSFWATTTATGELTHVAPDGGVLWQGDGYDFLGSHSVRSLDINPVDGSVWFGEAAQDWDDDCAHHLAANGTELWTSTDWMPPVYAVSVNPSDGSCWISTTAWFMVHFIYHYAEDGTLLWSDWAYRPLSISVDSGDGSVWYTDGMSPILWGYVVHLAADGSSLWWSAPEQFGDPYAVAANPRDGSCWVGDRDQLIYLAADGSELWRAAGYGPNTWGGAGTLAVNPRDGSCRLASVSGGYVARLNVVGVPQAAFVAKPAIGPATLTVHFEDWSLGTPTTWLWDFGDGATSSEQNPTHTYTAPGDYTVTLSVSNECGCDTVCDCVTVLPPQCATRTPGYWFTHPEALLTAFEAIAGDLDDAIDELDGTIALCDDCFVTPEDAMAIFWTARGLRATLAQHLLAALFNDALLKPAPDDIIEEAMDVLCSPDATNAQFSAALGPLAAYNQSGSSLSMIGYDFGSADPAAAKATAADGSVPDCVAVANGARRRTSASPLATRSIPSASARRNR